MQHVPAGADIGNFYGQQYADQAMWVVLFPGLAIVLSALSLQLLGDGLRDMLDPKLRKAL